MIRCPSYIKTLGLLFWVLGYESILHSQKIYMQNLGFSSNIYENVNGLCDYEIKTCETFRYRGANLFYTDGNLYDFITKDHTDSIYIQFNKNNLTSCEHTFISRLTFDLQTLWHPYTSFITSDHLGRIYFMLRTKPARINYICRINNFQDTVIQYLFPFNQSGPDFEFIEEMIFKKDKIYLFDRNNNKFIICDTLFNRISKSAILPVPASHFLSYSVSCDSISTYITYCSAADSTLNSQCFLNSFLGTYDFRTNTVTPICRINITTGSTAFFNLSPNSPVEFLSSDPECDLLIDLDRDNSSGVYPYDFKLHKSICLETSVAISDTDLFIQTSAPLDSIKLIIHGIRDGFLERLIANFSVSGFILNQLNDSTYSLKSILPATDSLYRAAFAAISYVHLGTNRTPGIRQIEVQGFNIHKAGHKIYSYITVASSRPYSGRDTTIIVCGTKKISGLSKLIGGQAGGRWTPALSVNDNYDSSIDLLDAYSYLIGDTVCGFDTAIVQLIKTGSVTPVIKNIDTVLCIGKLFSLAGRTYQDTGHFSQVIVNLQGCDSIIYDVRLRSSPIPRIKVSISREICVVGDTISLSVDTTYRQVLWGGNIFTPNNLPVAKTRLPGGYLVSGIDRYGCASTDTIMLRPPAFSITTNDMIDIDFIPDRPLDVSYSAIGQPSLYIWTPPMGLNCYDCAIPKLTDNIDRVYKIEAHSEVGCRYFDSILVTYKKPTSYFAPNIIKLQSLDNNNNSRFFIQGEESHPYDLEIFDRWGHVVFVGRDFLMNDSSSAWIPNDTNSSPGVYVYKVIIRTPTGDQLQAGDITVMQ